MTRFQLAVLRAVHARDGRAGWYQLDRMLTQGGDPWEPSVVSKQLMPVLRELERAGLVVAQPGPNAAMPLYSVSAAGLRIVAP